MDYELLELQSERDDAFERALTDVEAGRGPTSVHVGGLSHLLPEQIERFRPAWERLSERQKLALLDALHRHEVDALRYDFNAVYRLGMADENAAIRQRAIEATVEDDSPWLLDRLQSLLVHDSEAEVRAAAAAALDSFAQRAELGELPEADSERLRALLLETIHRPGERLDVRAQALATVGYFSGDRVRRELEAGFRDEVLKIYALRGMGHSADPVWTSTVVAELEDRDDLVRETAATAAGEIGDDSAVGALIDLIDDPSPEVGLAAIAALGEIGGDEAREALVYALDDERPDVREAAQAAIEEIDFWDEPLEL